MFMVIICQIMMMMVAVIIIAVDNDDNLGLAIIISTLFRSTGEDDVDLRGGCKNGFEDGAGEDHEEVEKDDLEGVEKEVGEENQEEEKTKEDKNENEETNEEGGEEEEDLEYLRLNCTRMSTRRATNFSQVGHNYHIFWAEDYLIF